MTIQEAISKIVENGFNHEIYSKICEVKSVDKNLKTCDVDPLDRSSSILDVKLSATESVNGFIVYPEIGSSVIVTFIDKDTAFLSMTTEIDEVIFNDGANGGLIKINELKKELTKNNNILSQIKNVFSSFTPVANDGGAALKTAMTSALSSLTVGDFSNIENEKIKH